MLAAAAMIPLKRDEGEDATSGGYDLVSTLAASSQTQLHPPSNVHFSAPSSSSAAASSSHLARRMVNPDADAGISGQASSLALLYCSQQPNYESSQSSNLFCSMQSPLYCRSKISGANLAESSTSHGFTQLPSPNQIPTQGYYMQQYPPQMQSFWQQQANVLSTHSNPSNHFLVRGKSGLAPFIGEDETLRLRGIRAEQQQQQQQQLEESCAPKSRWVPTPEQIQVLESLFNSGTTTPSRDQIADITMHVKRFGVVGEANIFYWFQNRKARAKRKQRQEAAIQEENSSSSDPLFDSRHSYRRVSSRSSQSTKDDNTSFIQQTHYNTNNINDERHAGFISSAQAQTHLGIGGGGSKDESLNITNLMQKGGCMPWSSSNPYATPDSASSSRRISHDSTSSIQPFVLRKMVPDPRVSLSLAPPAYILPLLAATSQPDLLHNTATAEGHPRAIDHLSSFVHSNPMRVLDPLTEDFFPKEHGRIGQVSNNNPQESLWDDVNPSSSDWEKAKTPASS